MLQDNKELDDLKYEMADEVLLETKIKVVGVGGGGSNAVARMMNEGLGGVEFHILNTDQQALYASPVANKVAIGSKITNGLGVGSDPSQGRRAALEDTDRIIEVLEGAEMVFVTAGLGGGTGTGAAPVVAALAKEMGALTVAVVTRPFSFEGPQRMKMAERGLADLASTVDTVISIPNDKLLELLPQGTSFVEAFRTADDVLRQGVQGISDIITTPGLINRDFSDIRAIMLGMGYAMMGTASASGKDSAIEAAKLAISCPLLEEGGVRGARGMLINITAAGSLGIHEVNQACTLIREATENDGVQVSFGVVLNEDMKDEVKITVIATGFQRDNLPQIERKPVTEFISYTDRQPAAMASAAEEFVVPVEEPAFTLGFPADSSTARESEFEFSGEETAGEEEEDYNETDTEEPQDLDMDDIEIPAIVRRERGVFSFSRRSDED